MTMFQRLKNIVLGPNIYRIHRSCDGQNRAYNYPKNSWEERTHLFLSAMFTSKQFAYYTSPLWTVLLYRRGYFNIETVFELTKLAGYPVIILMIVLISRAIGRQKNQEYISFLDVLEKVEHSPNNQHERKKLRGYDFDFASWPVDFRFDDAEIRKPKAFELKLWQRIIQKTDGSPWSNIVNLPKEILAYIVSHSFGIRVTYPGSVGLLKAAMGATLDASRYKVVEEQGGIRAKLRTREGNDIDTMFVDRRARDAESRFDPEEGPEVPTRNADILVVCCEGNAGFYEVGCMCTPLQAGYSVLGWNHPGFGCSTGQPFPDAEDNAIDVVMQYAIHKLHYPPENIILFGWSIGAFTVINAANMYPDVRGIFLDATFYDIMPFAKTMMPKTFEGFVKFTVRQHLNLHNSENLNKYNGPVSFVRRIQDEVMNIGGPTNIKSNLGNLLLEKFLRHRFPLLFEGKPPRYDLPGDDEQSMALWDWLNAKDDTSRDSILSSHEVDSDECKVLLGSYVHQHSAHPPINIGEDLSSEQKTQLVLFLADQHMLNYSSSHCTPLPASYFSPPWSIESLSSDSLLSPAPSASNRQSADSESSSDFELIAPNQNL